MEFYLNTEKPCDTASHVQRMLCRPNYFSFASGPVISSVCPGWEECVPIKPAPRAPSSDPASAALMGLIDHAAWGNASDVEGPDTPLANVSQGAAALGRWPVLTLIL